MSQPKSVAVIGATGYAGATAVSLLLAHPEVKVTMVTSRSHAGRRLADVFTGADTDLELAGETDPGDAEIVVVALPHGMTAGLAGAWREQGRTVVDLGADLRLKDPAAYERWYKVPHASPGLLASAVFGLPELTRAELAGAGLIACPGCYSSAAILALLPALRSGLVEPSVIVDAASGVSGAGRSLALGTHFAEVDEDFKAYSVEGHRHLPEMTQALVFGGPAPAITFVPHLVPMIRGILATCYLRPAGGASLDQIRLAYRDAYEFEPFVHVVDNAPRTKEVAGTNHCLIHITQQGDTIVVLAAIDNLVKGAAGQAVQALNVAMGWPETTALTAPARWP